MPYFEAKEFDDHLGRYVLRLRDIDNVRSTDDLYVKARNKDTGKIGFVRPKEIVNNRDKYEIDTYDDPSKFWDVVTGVESALSNVTGGLSTALMNTAESAVRSATGEGKFSDVFEKVQSGRNQRLQNYRSEYPLTDVAASTAASAIPLYAPGKVAQAVRYADPAMEIGVRGASAAVDKLKTAAQNFIKSIRNSRPATSSATGLSFGNTVLHPATVETASNVFVGTPAVLAGSAAGVAASTLQQQALESGSNPFDENIYNRVINEVHSSPAAYLGAVPYLGATTRQAFKGRALNSSGRTREVMDLISDRNLVETVKKSPLDSNPLHLKKMVDAYAKDYEERVTKAFEDLQTSSIRNIEEPINDILKAYDKYTEYVKSIISPDIESKSEAIKNLTKRFSEDINKLQDRLNEIGYTRKELNTLLSKRLKQARKLIGEEELRIRDELAELKGFMGKPRNYLEQIKNSFVDNFTKMARNETNTVIKENLVNKAKEVADRVIKELDIKPQNITPDKIMLIYDKIMLESVKELPDLVGKNKKSLVDGWATRASKMARVDELEKIVNYYSGDKSEKLQRSINALRTLDEAYMSTYGNRAGFSELSLDPSKSVNYSVMNPEERAKKFIQHYYDISGKTINFDELDKLEELRLINKKLNELKALKQIEVPSIKQDISDETNKYKNVLNELREDRKKVENFSLEKWLKRVYEGGIDNFDKNLSELTKEMSDIGIPKRLLGDFNVFTEKLKLYTLLKEAEKHGLLRESLINPKFNAHAVPMTESMEYPAIRQKVEYGIKNYDTLKDIEKALTTHAEPQKEGATVFKTVPDERAANYVQRFSKTHVGPMGEGSVLVGKVGENYITNDRSPIALEMALYTLKKSGKYDTARAAIELLKAGSKDGSIREAYIHNLLNRYPEVESEVMTLLEHELKKGGYRIVP